MIEEKNVSNLLEHISPRKITGLSFVAIGIFTVTAMSTDVDYLLREGWRGLVAGSILAGSGLYSLFDLKANLLVRALLSFIIVSGGLFMTAVTVVGVSGSGGSGAQILAVLAAYIFVAIATAGLTLYELLTAASKKL